MTLKQIILICIAVQFAVIVYSLHQAKEQRPSFTKLPQQEYMQNITVTHFTEEGKIKDQLQARYWAYIPAKQASVLQDPHLHLFKANGAEWVVRAKRGEAHHPTLEIKPSKLELTEDVIIERIANNNFTPVIMKTSQLFYFPDLELAETAEFVEMHKPGLIISGVGLKSDLQENIVTLLSKVTTQYAK